MAGIHLSDVVISAIVIWSRLVGRGVVTSVADVRSRCGRPRNVCSANHAQGSVSKEQRARWDSNRLGLEGEFQSISAPISGMKWSINDRMEKKRPDFRPSHVARTAPISTSIRVLSLTIRGRIGVFASGPDGLGSSWIRICAHRELFTEAFPSSLGRELPVG